MKNISTRKILTILSCILMMTMVFTRNVFADDSDQIKREIDGESADPVTVEETIETDGKSAVDLWAKNGATIEVNTQDIIVRANLDPEGISEPAIWPVAETNSIITIKTGNVTAADDGISANASQGAWINVNTDDINSKSRGVGVMAGGNSTVSIETKNIHSTDEEGVYLDNDNGSKVSVTVNGEIKADNDDGIYTETFNGSTTIVSVENGIDAQWGGIDSTTNYKNDDSTIYDTSKTEISVKGDITSNTTGIWLETGNNATADIRVDGNVDAEYYGIASYSKDGGVNNITIGESITAPSGVYVETIGSSSSVEVSGNVNGEDLGVEIWSEGESSSEVIVRDTISADIPVALYGDYGDTNLYTWKILSDSEEGLAFTGTEISEGEYKYTRDEDYEKENIHYFIRVIQPEEGGTVSVVKDADNNRSVNYDEPIALQDERIMIKAEPAEGYIVDGVYNGDTEIEPDGNGDYYFNVPAGGGVCISADFKKETEPEPAPQPEPEPAPQPEPVTPVKPAYTVPITGVDRMIRKEITVNQPNRSIPAIRKKKGY